jgi:uncharacterized protein YutE (UPF0331/DUF86 family)
LYPPSLRTFLTRATIGFRNILAQGYAELDHNKLYDIAVTHAPELLDAVRKALRDSPAPGQPQDD